MELASAAAMDVPAHAGSIAARRQSKFRKAPAVLSFVIAWAVALAAPANDMSRLPQDVEADLAAEREHTIRLGGLLGAERERSAQLTAQLQGVSAELAAERERGAQLTAQLQGVGAELAAERARNAPLAAQLQGVSAELIAERARCAHAVPRKD